MVPGRSLFGGFTVLVNKKSENMKKTKKTMVFSETAQLSFSYGDLVQVSHSANEQPLQET